MRRFFWSAPRCIAFVDRAGSDERDPHDETCAAVGCVFVMHAAPVQHHDVMDDCEPKSGATVNAGVALSIAAVEAFEELGLLLRRHARAVVLDGDFGHRLPVCLGLRYRDGDASAVEAGGR